MGEQADLIQGSRRRTPTRIRAAGRAVRQAHGVANEPGPTPESETVRARSAPRTSLRRVAFADRVLGSLWFIPLCAAVLALMASRLSLAFDDHLHRGPFTDVLIRGSASTLSAVAATLAAGMLTFLGVVFSTTLVAIQLASSQYSPRIVRVFVRSRLTQATLAIFMATFVFSVNTLVGTGKAPRASGPGLSMTIIYVLVLASVAMFLAFIHGMVRLLRVQYLLRLTARRSHEALDHSFIPADAYVAAAHPRTGPSVREVRTGERAAGGRRGTPRVLQSIDLGGLAADAARAGCWVEMCIAVGEHAGPLAVVARIHGADPSALGDEDVHARLLFGSERTMIQDPAFGIRQLVDTASRALSPAINDPTTGVQALQRVMDLLARIVDRPDPTGWYLDEDGTVRVFTPVDDFERLATLGFTEIIHYGADAPQVVRCLRACLRDLEGATSGERRRAIERIGSLCSQAVDESLRVSLRGLGEVPDRMGLG